MSLIRKKSRTCPLHPLHPTNQMTIPWSPENFLLRPQPNTTRISGTSKKILPPLFLVTTWTTMTMIIEKSHALRLWPLNCTAVFLCMVLPAIRYYFVHFVQWNGPSVFCGWENICMSKNSAEEFSEFFSQPMWLDPVFTKRSFSKFLKLLTVPTRTYWSNSRRIIGKYTECRTGEYSSHRRNLTKTLTTTHYCSRIDAPLWLNSIDHSPPLGRLKRVDIIWQKQFTSHKRDYLYLDYCMHLLCPGCID